LDTRIKKLCIIGVVLLLAVLSLAVVMVMVSRSPSVQREMSYMTGDVVVAGGRYAAVMVVPRDFNFFLDTSQEDHMGVDLFLYDPTDMKLSERIEVAARGREMNLKNEAKILGQDGKWLWVFGRSLVGVDLSGKRKIGVEELTRTNPELARLWMSESRYYSIDPKSKRLVFSVGDGRKFSLEPETLKAEAYVQPAQKQAKTREEYNQQLAEYSEAMQMFAVGPEKHFYSGERIGTGEWVGLLSEEELASVQQSWSLPGRTYGEGKRRRLYRLLLDTTDSRGARVANVEALGGDSYLEGGLLRAERAGKALRLSRPEGYLVMHRFRLGGTLMLTRVDLAGRKLWEFDSEVERLEQILPGEEHLGLVAKRRWLYSVDLKNGLMVQREMP
jgi:hypothetical protein